MRPLAISTLLIAALAAGCGPVERGAGRVGESCERDRDCARGLCVGGVGGPPDRVCTVSCGASTDCPEGWSCTGVTQGSVLVCQRGGATPFDPQ